MKATGAYLEVRHSFKINCSAKISKSSACTEGELTHTIGSRPSKQLATFCCSR